MVAVLGVAAIAFAAILLYEAWNYYGSAFVRVVPDWHIPLLGNLRDAVQGLLSSAIAGFGTVLDAAIGPLVGLIRVPIDAVEGAVATAADAIRSAASLLNEIVTQRIPLVQLWTANLVTTAEHDLTALINVGLADAHTALSEVEYYLATLINGAEAAAIGYAETLFDNARTAIGEVEYYLAVQINNAESEAVNYAAKVGAAAAADLAAGLDELRSLVASAEAATLHTTAGWVTDAEQYAQSVAAAAVGIAVTDVDTAVAGAVSAVWPDVTGAVGGLETALGAGWADVKAGLAAIPQVSPATAAGALAGIAALAIPLVRLAEDCTVPNCRNLSGVGQQMQGVFGDLGALGILGLIAAAAADPQGTADVVAPLIDGTAQAGKAILDGLLAAA